MRAQDIEDADWRAELLLVFAAPAVPAQLAARVAAAQDAELERWFDRAMDAAALDDVFDNA